MRGTVKFYRSNGWGYIVPEDGGPDVFVHATVLPAGTEYLTENQLVEMQTRDQGPGKGPAVTSLEVLSAPDAEAWQRICGDSQPAKSRFERVGSQALLKWAFFPSIPRALEDLRQRALPEPWEFGDDNDPEHPHPVLWNYLRFTFAKLERDGSVCYSKGFAEELAAFNTGLVNRLYDPIYALFERHERPEMNPWCFRAFCVEGERGHGKDLVRAFNPLPKAAQYFEHVTDLLYTEPDCPPSIDWDHVILDGIRRNRLPLAFLEDLVAGKFKDWETGQTNGNDLDGHLASLAEAVENDLKTFRLIKSRFEQALDLALKRVRWNFKTAIPMWYPVSGKMTLLLPLSLIDDEQVDVALVVEKTESGSYLGHTILPLDWAYTDARLVCRPDSDWLIPKHISFSGEAAEQSELPAVAED